MSIATTAPSQSTALDYKNLANAIRFLAIDAVEAANSGHPGMPMGMADVASVLFHDFMKFDATAPLWPDRDRFILSAGHGSMLLYALGYLLGYEKMTLEQIKNFRQLGSLTAGHPEVMPEIGIETTTGPLGQGISTAAGFSLAERMMNARFGDDLVNHYTYVIASDGDLQEGVSHEACALAGHMGLSKLIVLYDDNQISIDGPTSLSFTEDVLKRYDAYNWHTARIDGHDPAAIHAAILAAQAETDRPSIIACRTKIGFGAPTKEGKSSSHGSPLGADEIAGARKNLNWPHAPFDVPSDILNTWRAVGTRGTEMRKAWEKNISTDFTNAMNADVSAIAAPVIASFKQKTAADKPKVATRQASGNTLAVLVPAIQQMIGGSADLTGSNNTIVDKNAIISKDSGYKGQYIHYGVREHGMAAMMNGMALHGGIIPYSGTFLTFSDYCRPSIRLAALMKQRVIHVMTHDSIGLGEDGPTHQPVEHLAALRAIPNCYVYRPCDQIETAEAWQCALDNQHAPAILSLTRQSLPTLCDRRDITQNMTARGAYILMDCDGEPDITLFASGSEVEIIVQAADVLSKTKKVRVVSVPCMDLFWVQDGAYQQSILCNASRKIAVEAAVRDGWDRIIGPHGTFIGMTGFGESAPAPELYKHFGITAEKVIEAANR